jgi:hypothetical protein
VLCVVVRSTPCFLWPIWFFLHRHPMFPFCATSYLLDCAVVSG